MPERLLIYGASGHGVVIAEAARLSGWEVLGFADDDPARQGTTPGGWLVVALGLDQAMAVLHRESARFVAGIGDNTIRRQVYERLLAAGGEAGTVIHPSAVVSPSARIGPGSVVLAGAVINPGAVVGANAILNTACSVDHDNRIGDHAHLSPGAHLGGTVTVGAGTHIGLGTAVRNNVQIGAWSVVGMGSVVVGDIPDRVVAYGCPARIQRGVA